MEMPRQLVLPPRAAREDSVRYFRFGTFELDRDSGEVRKRGLRIQIQDIQETPEIVQIRLADFVLVVDHAVYI